MGDPNVIPNIENVRQHIESYQEVEEAKAHSSEGGRPLTFTGIKGADKLNYINYQGDKVFGSLLFKTDYKGKINYHHSHLWVNMKPKEEYVDRTWMVMKRIEYDLEHKFNITKHTERTTVGFHGTQGRN